jgi:hypothetical protein
MSFLVWLSHRCIHPVWAVDTKSELQTTIDKSLVTQTWGNHCYLEIFVCFSSGFVFPPWLQWSLWVTNRHFFPNQCLEPWASPRILFPVALFIEPCPDILGDMVSRRHVSFGQDIVLGGRIAAELFAATWCNTCSKWKGVKSIRHATRHPRTQIGNFRTEEQVPVAAIIQGEKLPL